ETRLQSFRITEKRSSAEAFGVALWLCAAVACSRPSDKKPAPRSATTETAQAVETAAPSATPSTDAPALEATNGPPPPPTATASTAGAEPAALESVSAERLLAEVRRLGEKGTLVNAWASWCGPCKHEIPMLQKLATKFAPNGLHVVLVSLDEPGDRDKAA